MKRLLFGLLLLATVGAVFAFAKPEKKHGTVNPVFYRYTLSTYSEPQIKDYLNYVRATESCNDGIHVCGVFLDTDNGLGNPPDATEFDAVKNGLWNSEVNHESTDQDLIKMRD
jgi:hypothetical protein